MKSQVNLGLQPGSQSSTELCSLSHTSAWEEGTFPEINEKKIKPRNYTNLLKKLLLSKGEPC